MIWKMVDWGWIVVLAVCCCMVGSRLAYDRSVAESMTAGMEYQPFLILLETDVSPQDRMTLRGYLTSWKAFVIKWLSSDGTVVARISGAVGRGDIELIKDNLPKAVEPSGSHPTTARRKFRSESLQFFRSDRQLLLG
jgi:hypothetical protein